ncbi:MAG: hypothetical protein QXL52_01380 [Nitrososphaerales archaeon]
MVNGLDIKERMIQLLANLNAVSFDKALDVETLKENLKLENGMIKRIIMELSNKGYLIEEKNKVYLTTTGIIRAFSYYS